MDLTQLDIKSEAPLTNEEIEIIRSVRVLFSPQLLKMVDEVKVLIKEFGSVDVAVEDAIKKVNFMMRDGHKLPEEFYYSQVFMLRILNANVFDLDELMDEVETEFLVAYLVGFSKSVKELI